MSNIKLFFGYEITKSGKVGICLRIVENNKPSFDGFNLGKITNTEKLAKELFFINFKKKLNICL